MSRCPARTAASANVQSITSRCALLPPIFPQVEASRQQVLNCLSVRAMVEGRQSLNDGQTNIAIDRSQLSAVSRGLAHRLEPAIECSDVTGSEL